MNRGRTQVLYIYYIDIFYEFASPSLFYGPYSCRGRSNRTTLEKATIAWIGVKTLIYRCARTSALHQIILESLLHLRLTIKLLDERSNACHRFLSCVTIQCPSKATWSNALNSHTATKNRSTTMIHDDDDEDSAWRTFLVLSHVQIDEEWLRTSRNRVDGASPSAWVPCPATAVAHLNATRSNRESRWLFVDGIPRPSPSRSSFGSYTYASAGTPPRNLATPTVTATPRILDYWRSSDCSLKISDNTNSSIYQF